MALTRTARDERGSHQHTFRRVRVPPNFFTAVALLTGFIAWIAARTAPLAVRGRLFPHPDPA